MPIITKGNSKIKNIYNFNLPAVTTCPGATTECLRDCYATGGRYHQKNIKDKYAYNLDLSKTEHFVAIINNALYDEIKTKQMKVVRIHSSGDFYSVDYINKWIKIANDNPDWKFYAYTRSWRVAELLVKLEEFKKLDNVILYASTDKSSGDPPEGWLEAGYLEIKSDEYHICHRDAGCSNCLYCVEGKGNVFFEDSL